MSAPARNACALAASESFRRDAPAPTTLDTAALASEGCSDSESVRPRRADDV